MIYIYIYILCGYAYTLAWIDWYVCIYICIVHCSSGCQKFSYWNGENMRKLLFLIKSFSSAQIRSVSFSCFILASNAWPYELPCSSPCGLHSQVELAQNDVVFCAGGVAEASYLVLSLLDCVGWPAKLPGLIVNRVRGAINQRCGQFAHCVHKHRWWCGWLWCENHKILKWFCALCHT